MDVRSFLKAGVVGVCSVFATTAMADERPECAVSIEDIASFETVKTDEGRFIVAVDQDGEGICTMSFNDFVTNSVQGKAGVVVHRDQQPVVFNREQKSVAFTR